MDADPEKAAQVSKLVENVSNVRVRAVKPSEVINSDIQITSVKSEVNSQKSNPREKIHKAHTRLESREPQEPIKTIAATTASANAIKAKSGIGIEKANAAQAQKSNLHTTSEKLDLVASGQSVNPAGDLDNSKTLERDEPSPPQITKVQRTVLEEHGFTIGKQIGSGTYAKVKVAFSVEYKGPVAIKIISKVKAPAEYLTKFLPREIEVVKGLRHENLIKFYQSIETTHRVYIIMQLAENGSLLDLIRSKGYLSEGRSRKYFRQLINAIEYCHGQGVVHRDIKCENLLLDKDFNLKVIDFGFARRNMKPTNGPVLSETYCGSYAYASPEVLKGVPYDPHMSDVWACGVVLYAMVFGRLPFDGSNYNQLLKQVQSKLSFPKNPNVSILCKSLLIRIMAPLKIRFKFHQIKQDSWTKMEMLKADGD